MLIKSKHVELIEADSQVTTPYPDLPNTWLLDSVTEKLIQCDHLRFAHGTFGNYHHTFFLRLRDIDDDCREEITSHLIQTYKDFFKREPDLILCPSDSTGFDILENNNEIPNDSYVMLGKFRQEYDNYELRLELSIQHRKKLKEQKKLNILFFDDSKSSGKTEHKALKALLRVIKKYGKKEINWLSYVVLRRGERMNASSQSQSRKSKIQHDLHEIVCLNVHYCAIGPESRTERRCPFEEAVRRLSIVRNIARYGRGDFVELINKISRCIEEQPIDRTDFQSIVTQEITRNLLHLCNLNMPGACTRITSNLGSKLSKDQAAASVLFTSLYFADIMNFMCIGDVTEVFRRFAQDVNEDEQESSIVLLMALSLLPGSATERMYYKLLRVLIKANSPNTASAVLAIMLAGHDYISERFRELPLHAQNYDDLMNAIIVKNPIIHRRRRLVADVKKNLNLDIFNSDEDMYADRICELVQTDFNAFSSQNDTEHVVKIAGKLAAMAYDGGHKFFLLRRIENSTLETLPSVLRDIKITIKLARRLSELLNVNITSALSNYEKELDEISTHITDNRIDEFIEAAMDFHSYIWKSGPFIPFFYFPKRLLNFIQLGRDKIKDMFSACNMPQGLFKILKPSEKISMWHYLAPDTPSMAEHIDNVLNNSLQHFYGPNIKENSNINKQFFENLSKEGYGFDSPLMYIYMRVDLEKDAFFLEFANRAAKPKLEKLFYPSGCLGSSKIRFQAFGGDITYKYSNEGLLQSWLSDVEQSDKDTIVDPRAYKNIFIARMPLIWKDKA